MWSVTHPRKVKLDQSLYHHLYCIFAIELCKASIFIKFQTSHHSAHWYPAQAITQVCSVSVGIQVLSIKVCSLSSVATHQGMLPGSHRSTPAPPGGNLNSHSSHSPPRKKLYTLMLAQPATNSVPHHRYCVGKLHAPRGAFKYQIKCLIGKISQNLKGRLFNHPEIWQGCQLNCCLWNIWMRDMIISTSNLVVRDFGRSNHKMFYRLFITMTSHKHHSVSNNQHLDNSFNISFQLTTK